MGAGNEGVLQLASFSGNLKREKLTSSDLFNVFHTNINRNKSKIISFAQYLGNVEQLPKVCVWHRVERRRPVGRAPFDREGRLGKLIRQPDAVADLGVEREELQKRSV